VPGHEIPLDTFVHTSQEAAALIRSMGRDLFDDQLQVELLLLPPEEGSFLTRLRVVVVAGAVAIGWFIESDVGKGFLKGLTGHEPAYWAEQLGRSVKETTIAIVEEFDAQASAEEVHVVADDEFGSFLVAEMAKSFLEKDNVELARAGITPRRLRGAFEAKNKFYQACLATPELEGVGFSEYADFPIRRADFVRLQAVLPAEDERIEPPWFVDIVVLKVTSPNWDRDDRARGWKGHDQQRRDRHFRIDDDEFWQRVFNQTISTHVSDVMKVQWAYQGKPDHPKHCRVLRVLEYNGEPLSKPLSDEELVAELGKLAEHPLEQGGLFGDHFSSI
jgi:hypothetical protein